MADPEGNRKLVAILAADVAGYSRLMQDDDEATVTTLEAYRAVFRETIQAHRGRVVDMAGDSVLAVFETATGAVRAAFEIHRRYWQSTTKRCQTRAACVFASESISAKSSKDKTAPYTAMVSRGPVGEYR